MIGGFGGRLEGARVYNAVVRLRVLSGVGWKKSKDRPRRTAISFQITCS